MQHVTPAPSIPSDSTTVAGSANAGSSTAAATPVTAPLVAGAGSSPAIDCPASARSAMPPSGATTVEVPSTGPRDPPSAIHHARIVEAASTVDVVTRGNA